MIYWNDVKNRLLGHCPSQMKQDSDKYNLIAIAHYLNKEQGLSLQRMAEIAGCSRTTLHLKLRQMRGS